MNVIVPAPGRPGRLVPRPAVQDSPQQRSGSRMVDDVMTRRQVASLFGVTSAAVAIWARRGRLPEIRNEAGRPRYRRADVEALFRTGLRRRPR